MVVKEAFDAQIMDMEAYVEDSTLINHIGLACADDPASMSRPAEILVLKDDDLTTAEFNKKP